MVNNTLLVGLVLAAGAALLRRRRRPAARAPPPPPSPWLTAADAEKPHGRSKGARSHAGEQKRRPSAAGAPGGKPRDEGDGADSDANGMLWATLDLLVTLVTAACTLAAVALLVLRGTPDLGVLVAAAWAAQAARAQAKLVYARRHRAAAAAAAAAAARCPAEAAAPPSAPPPDIAGTWVKDTAASDSLEPIMDAMRLNGLLRAAIRLLRNLEVKLDEQRFSFGLFSLVKWFKIVEGFSMDGGVSYLRRRDLRGGKQRGAVRVTPRGTLLVSYEWDAPLAGRGEDEFELSKGRLLVHSANWVAGREIRYTQVYDRRA